MATTQQRAIRPDDVGRMPVIAAVVLLLTTSGFALDPHASLGQFRLARWDEDQGLPENYTSNIAQTKDGFIWLAFDHGLIRFDGKNFATGQELGTKIEPPGKVFGLVPGQAGELWIGSYRSLYRRSAIGEFQRFDSKDGLPNDYLTALFLDHECTLWIGTDSHGLFRLKNGQFSCYPGSLELSQHYIYSMCETAHAFWIGTALGAYEIDKTSGDIKKFTDRDGLPGNQVYGITTDREDRVWAGTGNGLARLNDHACFEAASGELGRHSIQSLMTDSHGMLWASGPGGGLWRINPGTGSISSLPQEDGCPLPDIQSVYEDREGNIWLATSAGLERLSDVQFTVYTTNEGLPNDQITAVTPGRGNRIWIGTLNGLASLNSGRIETVQSGTRGEVTSLHEDSRGVLWFGLRNATLHRLAGGQDETIANLNVTEQGGLAWATGMCSGPAGDLWVGTIGAGLSHFRNGIALKTYTPADGMRDRAVYALAMDHDQKIWIGEAEAVDLLEKSAVKPMLGETPQRLPNSVLCFYADAAGAMWAGTDNGLYRYKDGRWASRIYRPDQRILGPEFDCLLEDDHDNLWSSGSRGIFFVSKHELNEFFDGRDASVRCHSFGKADGMRSPECTQGFPAGCRSSDGKLWFATTAGLAVIDPNHLRFNALPPPVQIEKLIVDLTEEHPLRPGGQRVILGPGTHSLEIDYAGLSFSAPEKVRFRYKLEGFDRDWIDAGGRREAYYTNLAPRTYRFKVVACNNDGVWLSESTAATFLLKVRHHFYQTLWFYALCAGAAMAAVWLLWKWRLRQILDERTRMSRELHDTAARGMVALIWQIERAKNILKKRRFDALFANLDQASNIARENLRDTRRAVRALRSEVFDSDCCLAVALQKAVHEAANGSGLRTELKVSGAPYSTSRRWEEALLRITQESLANTLKYAQAKRFEIELCYSPSEIQLRLCDDGIGFDYHSAYRKSTPDDTWMGGGLGLLGVQERVRQLGGQIQIDSSANRGTTIQVTVPSPPQFWRWFKAILPGQAVRN
ncbi:MAG: hypothetical protein JO333_15840 [Verrucomicrobia bacterium]|nr:hypothetical protein [Verrucomicrobiota bacterium]